MILPDDGFLEQVAQLVDDALEDTQPFDGEFIPVEGVNPEWEPRYMFISCEENNT
jgi:hypothetical protein